LALEGIQGDLSSLEMILAAGSISNFRRFFSLLLLDGHMNGDGMSRRRKKS
jgi:hypothetical protein